MVGKNGMDMQGFFLPMTPQDAGNRKARDQRTLLGNTRPGFFNGIKGVLDERICF